MKKIQKILVVVGFIALVAFLAFLIYIFFIRQPLLQPDKDVKETGFGQLPIIGRRLDSNIVDTDMTLETQDESSYFDTNSYDKADGISEELSVLKANNISLAQDGSLRFYSSDNNKFYRVTSDGVSTPLSSKLFYSVESVTWSRDANKAILEYPDGKNVYYNFSTSKQYTLPDNWHDFSFDPSGQKIVFMNDDINPENRWLAIANPDGTSVEFINQVGDNANKVIPSWSSDGSVVAFSKTGEAMGAWMQEIYLIGKNDENFPSLKVNGRGFEPKWAEDTNTLLYSVYNAETNYNPELWIATSEDNNVAAQNINLRINTWARKCDFNLDSSKLYCAVPDNLEKASGLFPELSGSYTENIYEIDMKTGKKSEIASPDGRISVEQLFVSSNETEVYYKNEITGLIEKIKLR